jgi:hypothetical protein
MNNLEQKALLDKHPNYRITFLNEEALRNELKSWDREDLISWLKWNDPNGIYRDEESMDEIGSILTHEEGVEIIVRQIIQN